MDYYISTTNYSVQERQTQSGKVYDCVFRVITLDGQVKQKKLCGFKTKNALKDAHADFIAKFCRPLTSYRGQRQGGSTGSLPPLFTDLYAEYIFSIQNQVKHSTLRDKEKFNRLYLTPFFGNLRINEITKTLLYQWQDKMWTSKNPRTGDFYSFQYLSNARNYLSAFLSWVEERYNFPNLLRSVKKPKRRSPKTEMRFWTRQQFDKFLSVITNKSHRAFFSILFYTGKRKGEVIALHYSDVQGDRICFSKTYSRKTIDGTPYKITSTKNEKRLTTPICKTLQKILQEYEGGKPFYFGGKTPMHENTLSHAFERYTTAAQLPKIRVHDLRHSFVSMCLHLGASVYTVADLIGDSVEQVFKTYGHLYDEDKQKIIDKIG